MRLACRTCTFSAPRRSARCPQSRIVAAGQPNRKSVLGLYPVPLAASAASLGFGDTQSPGGALAWRRDHRHFIVRYRRRPIGGHLSRTRGHLCARSSPMSVPGMRSLRSTIFETSAVRSSVSAKMISGFSRSSLPLRPGTTFRTSCSPSSVSGSWSVWSGSLHSQSKRAR